MQRALSGAVLSFSLHDEMRIVRDELASERDRIARTLLKDGALRVTLVALKPGAHLGAHRADGPILVQVLEGSVEFHVAGSSVPLPEGSLLSLEAGLEHSVSSAAGGIFLLTVVAQAALPPDLRQHPDE
ncbi:MAG TPA: cupin domain-containing protein [Gemmatimonadales bacterium]|nr:cupin domain-containing protein [Gemmatimonadales bacterium]